MSDPGRNLEIALELAALGKEMMRERLRRDDPAASDEQIEERLAAWMRTRPGAEDGDGVGVPGRWPREAP